MNGGICGFEEYKMDDRIYVMDDYHVVQATESGRSVMYICCNLLIYHCFTVVLTFPVRFEHVGYKGRETQSACFLIYHIEIGCIVLFTDIPSIRFLGVFGPFGNSVEGDDPGNMKVCVIWILIFAQQIPERLVGEVELRDLLTVRASLVILRGTRHL